MRWDGDGARWGARGEVGRARCDVGRARVREPVHVPRGGSPGGRGLSLLEPWAPALLGAVSWHEALLGPGSEKCVDVVLLRKDISSRGGEGRGHKRPPSLGFSGFGARRRVRTFVREEQGHQDLSLLYLQVWGVKYNGNGSKIVSVGDDQEIHVYDCPI